MSKFINSDCNCDIDDVYIDNNCFVLKSKLNQKSIFVTKELIQASFM